MRAKPSSANEDTVRPNGFKVPPAVSLGHTATTLDYTATAHSPTLLRHSKSPADTRWRRKSLTNQKRSNATAGPTNKAKRPTLLSPCVALTLPVQTLLNCTQQSCATYATRHAWSPEPSKLGRALQAAPLHPVVRSAAGINDLPVRGSVACPTAPTLQTHVHENATRPLTRSSREGGWQQFPTNPKQRCYAQQIHEQCSITSSRAI